MPKSEVQIELITKKDIRSSEIGREVFNILKTSSEKVLPEYVSKIEPVNIRIDSLETWLEHWSSPECSRYEGVTHDFDSGLIWRRRKSLKSWGAVTHGHDLIHQGSSVFISSTWNKSVEWESIFDLLVGIIEPEYAGIHVFGSDELSMRKSGEPFQVLAIWKLVSYKYEGNWRRPDSFDLKAWRDYRHLPDLPFKAYLSQGFKDQYDLSKLEEIGCLKHKGKGVYVKIADDLDFVVNDFPSFTTKRKKVRSAFSTGFFTELNEI